MEALSSRSRVSEAENVCLFRFGPGPVTMMNCTNVVALQMVCTCSDNFVVCATKLIVVFQPHACFCFCSNRCTMIVNKLTGAWTDPGAAGESFSSGLQASLSQLSTGSSRGTSPYCWHTSKPAESVLKQDAKSVPPSPPDWPPKVWGKVGKVGGSQKRIPRWCRCNITCLKPASTSEMRDGKWWECRLISLSILTE